MSRLVDAYIKHLWVKEDLYQPWQTSLTVVLCWLTIQLSLASFIVNKNMDIANIHTSTHRWDKPDQVRTHDQSFQPLSFIIDREYKI